MGGSGGNPVVIIAVDTNVVVRLLTQDDDDQYQRSLALFQAEASILILTTVILETAWVLRAVYGFEPGAICGALRQGLGFAQCAGESRAASSPGSAMA